MFFFFHLNAVWSTSVTRPLHHSLTVKNRKTPDNKALVFIVTDVRMRALTSRNRSLMEESGIRFLCDGLGFTPMMGKGFGDLKDLTVRGGRITQTSSPNSHRWILKRLQSGLFSAGRCIEGPISVFWGERGGRHLGQSLVKHSSASWLTTGQRRVLSVACCTNRKHCLITNWLKWQWRNPTEPCRMW